MYLPLYNREKSCGKGRAGMPKGGFKQISGEAEGDRNRLLDILLDREMDRTKKSEEDFVSGLVDQWRRIRGNALHALGESMESRRIVQLAKEAWHPGKAELDAQSVDLVMTIAVLYWERDPSSAFLSPSGAEAVLAAVLVMLTEGTQVSAVQVIEALLVARGVVTVLGRQILLDNAVQDCRYHCGLIAAPAAAALATLSGGTAQMISDAMALAMLHCIGYDCLPQGEMVQLPCAGRNAAQALNAVISAERALRGETAELGPDEALVRLCNLQDE